MAVQADHIDFDDTRRLENGVTQPDIVRSPLARTLLALLRLVMGWTFLWPFIDKLFGLGFGTPSERAWVNGGTPAQGFMKNATGPFADMFKGMADAMGPFADWMFMISLLLIGIAFITGCGLKLAAWGGALLMVLMYLAQFPLGQGPDFHATNPITDSHWIEGLALLVCAHTLAGDTLGLGTWWNRIVGNGILR